MMDKIPTAQDCMDLSFHAVRETMPAYEAIDILVAKKKTGLPVTREDGTLAGVFNEKDGTTRNPYSLKAYMAKDWP